MNQMELFEHLTDIDDALILDVDNIPARQKSGVLLRLVLVAALISLMTVTITAATRGMAKIVVTPTDTGYMVGFANLDIKPPEHSDWYPQSLPAGYEEKYVSSNEQHFRSITFMDGEDGKLMFTYGPAGYIPDYTIEGSASSERTRVGRFDARMFSTVTEQTDYIDGKAVSVQVYDEWLFWVDGERKLGFVLRYAAVEKLDLISIAESVIQVEQLEATYQYTADAAVVKLGDYRPGWMPEGYEYVITYGDPINPLLSPDYPGHVHRVYRNEWNYEVHLFYEYIPVYRSSRAGVVMGNLIQEAIDLNGTPATYYETPWGAAYAIVWQRQDVERIPLTFTLYSDGISSTESISKEDLIRMAESITMIMAADTSHFER